MSLRIDNHALFSRESRQPAERRHVAGALAQNLVAERNGIVEEAAQRILVGALFEQRYGIVDLSDAQMQVAYAIAERDVHIIGAAMFGEQLLVQRERLLGLFFQLESGGLLFEHCRRGGHAEDDGVTGGGPAQPITTKVGLSHSCLKRLRDRGPACQCRIYATRRQSVPRYVTP